MFSPSFFRLIRHVVRRYCRGVLLQKNLLQAIQHLSPFSKQHTCALRTWNCCKKVLFQAATKSVHSTTLSGLLSVETTVCITNVIAHWSALSRSNQVYSQSSWVNNVTVRNGLICRPNCGKMDFWGKVQTVHYLRKSALEKYLPFAQDTFLKSISKILR